MRRRSKKARKPDPNRRQDHARLASAAGEREREARPGAGRCEQPGRREERQRHQVDLDEIAREPAEPRRVDRPDSPGDYRGAEHQVARPGHPAGVARRGQHPAGETHGGEGHREREDAQAVAVEGDQQLAAEAAERVDERREGEDAQVARRLHPLPPAEQAEQQLGVDEQHAGGGHLEGGEQQRAEPVGLHLARRLGAQGDEGRVEGAGHRLLHDARGERREEIGEEVLADPRAGEARAEDPGIEVGDAQLQQPDTAERQALAQEREERTRAAGQRHRPRGDAPQHRGVGGGGDDLRQHQAPDAAPAEGEGDRGAGEGEAPHQLGQQRALDLQLALEPGERHRGEPLEQHVDGHRAQHRHHRGHRVVEEQGEGGRAKGHRRGEQRTPAELEGGEGAVGRRVEPDDVTGQADVTHRGEDQEDRLHPAPDPPVLGRQEAAQQQVGGEHEPHAPDLRQGGGARGAEEPAGGVVRAHAEWKLTGGAEGEYQRGPRPTPGAWYP